MKTILFVFTLVALLSFATENKLAGRWESAPSMNGNVTGAVFKEDGSFEGYVNRKPFVTGTYALKDSILSFTDNGCMGMEGVYKVAFFSNSDSLRFQAISDNCSERKAGMERLTLGRVK